MKKSLTIAGAALAVALGLTSCGDTTANTSTDTTVPRKFDAPNGTVEDRRPPMTVPVITAAPTTSTTSDQFPDTGAYATAATLGADPAVMNGLGAMIRDNDAIWAAVDVEDVPALQAACQRQIGHAQDVYYALSFYSGPLVDQITEGLVLAVIADTDCVDGNFVDAADEFVAAAEYWSTLADSL